MPAWWDDKKHIVYDLTVRSAARRWQTSVWEKLNITKTMTLTQCCALSLEEISEHLAMKDALLDAEQNTVCCFVFAAKGLESSGNASVAKPTKCRTEATTGSRAASFGGWENLCLTLKYVC